MRTPVRRVAPSDAAQPRSIVPTLPGVADPELFILPEPLDPDSLYLAATRYAAGLGDHSGVVAEAVSRQVLAALDDQELVRRYDEDLLA